MKKCNFVLLVLFIFIVSCSQNTENSVKSNVSKVNNFDEKSLDDILTLPITFSDKEYTLEKVKEINIPIDSVSQNWSKYPVYYDADTTQYYIQGNEAIHSIDFYDLDRKTLYKRIKLEKTGTEAIHSVTKFFIKNIDSIYIFETGHGKINLVDNEGHILAHYSLPQKYMFNVSTSMTSNFSIYGDKAYFTSDMFSGLHISEVTEKLIKGKKMVAVFDLNTEQLDFTEPQIPIYLASEKLPISLFGCSSHFSNEIFLQQTNFTGIIYHSKNKKDYQQTLLHRKGFLNEEAKKSRRGDNGIVYDNHFLILADKKSNLFYSVILEGIEEKDLDGKPNSYNDRPITIVIADENFHHAGEITLPKDTHFRNVMATRDGLLVSNANPKNPNNDEGALSFTLYKPKKIK